MQLLVDVGNSRLKWNTAQQGQLQGDTQAFDWCAGNLPDELLKQWLALRGIRSVWIANVANQALAESITAFSKQYWGIEPRYAHTEKQQCGITNAYRDHTRLGVDRWLCLLAAWSRFPYNSACVIGCGTVITIDFLSAQGEHLGGAIAPGPQLMQQALQDKSTVIDETIKAEQGTLMQGNDANKSYWQQNLSGSVGKTTQECISIGTRQACTGFIRTMIEKAQQQLTNACKVILTGGNAPFLMQELTKQLGEPLAKTFTHEPNLVMHGLLIYGDDKS